MISDDVPFDLPPPEAYQTFLQEVELRGARLVACEVSTSQMVHDPAQVAYEIDVETRFDRFEEGFEAIQDCTIHFFVPEREEDVPVSRIQVAYGFGYECSFEEEEYEFDAYLHIFEQVSLPVNAWPFIRQFVHDITQRMNWPPLMLPLLKPDSAEEDEASDR